MLVYDFFFRKPKFMVEEFILQKDLLGMCVHVDMGALMLIYLFAE